MLAGFAGSQLYVATTGQATASVVLVQDPTYFRHQQLANFVQQKEYVLDADLMLTLAGGDKITQRKLSVGSPFHSVMPLRSGTGHSSWACAAGALACHEPQLQSHCSPPHSPCK